MKRFHVGTSSSDLPLICFDRLSPDSVAVILGCPRGVALQLSSACGRRCRAPDCVAPPLNCCSSQWCAFCCRGMRVTTPDLHPQPVPGQSQPGAWWEAGFQTLSAECYQLTSGCDLGWMLPGDGLSVPKATEKQFFLTSWPPGGENTWQSTALGA